MRFHALLLAAAIACVYCTPARADSLVEDFNAGISAERWDIFTFSASGAPWTVSAPDAEGRLHISKPADNDSSTYYHELDGAITSKFTLVGDFAISIDFDLLQFPMEPAIGANEALLRVFAGSNYFEVLRGVNTGHFAGVSNNVAADPGYVADSTMHGRLGLTRAGQTLSGWIDRGAGMDLLGSVSSPLFLAPMNVQLFGCQVPWNPGVPVPRPNTALDVRFDNLVIVPEPAMLSLLMLGGLVAIRRRRDS